MLLEVLDKGRLAPFTDPCAVDDLAAAVAGVAHIRELSRLDAAFTYPIVKEFFLYTGDVDDSCDGRSPVFPFFQETDDGIE